jgi:hypothetical protein
MKILISVFTILLSLASLEAFILISPTYRLANPTEVIVEISSEGCRDNGISDAELTGYLEEAVDDYWNTVPDSLLYLKVEGNSTYSATEDAPAGKIIVGCGSLGSGIAGVANPNNTGNGCRVRLASGVYIGGSIVRESLMATLIHELGHCVGLNHSNDTASVMTYNDKVYVKPAALSRDDKDAVTYLYPYESKGSVFGSCSLIASEGNNSTRSGWLVLLCGFLLTVGIRKFIKRFS